MVGLLAFAAVYVSDCPIERARYVLRHHGDVTASFRAVGSGSDWPSGIALAVHDRRSARTSWWLPWVGGTDGLHNIASTTDVTKKGWRPPNPDGGPRPYGDRQYLATDEAYNILDRPLRRGTIAPAHLLFPNSAGLSDRAFPAKQFFDLVGCSRNER